jgi:uncharacterized protein (TIGR02246 family)
MRMLRVLCTALLLGPTLSLAEAPSDAVKQEIVQVLVGLDDAWERGDIDAMFSYFTPDFEYVNAGDGFYWRTRDEQRQGWSRVRPSGALPKTVEQTFRLIAPDVVVVVSRLAIYREDAPADAAPIGFGMSSFVLKHQDDRWLISFSQGTPVSSRASPVP